MKPPKVMYFNGKIVPYAEAKISVLTYSMHYGTSVFGGMRGFWNDADKQMLIFRPIDHFTRLLQSTKLLNMEFPYSAEDLTKATVELLKAEGCKEDCYIRPLVYFNEELIAGAPDFSKTGIAIAAIPFEAVAKKPNGAHACVSGWRRVDDTMIPARGKIGGAYVNSFLAKTDAVRSGYDEAILLNVDGHVAEGSIMNIFIVRNGVAITPSVNNNILEGITRRSLMALLRDELQVEVQERTIDRSELYIADEIFFCGTAAQVAPVTKVDHRTIGTGAVGKITASLASLYNDVLRGRNKKYADWCVPVYEHSNSAAKI